MRYVSAKSHLLSAGRMVTVVGAALVVTSIAACSDGGGDPEPTTASVAARSSSPGDPESGSPNASARTEPDHIAALSADAFGDLCTGPIHDSLVGIAPDVWASASGDAAEEVAVNVDAEEGDVACVWDGPDGTALYAEYKPLPTVSDELLTEPGATPDDDLAAAGGTTEAYILNKDEFDSYGAAWVSGDAVFVVSTDTDESVVKLTADDFTEIVQSLPAVDPSGVGSDATDAAPQSEESNDMLLELSGDCLEASDVSDTVGMEVDGGVGAEGDSSRTCTYTNYDETSDGYTRGDAVIYLYGPDLVPWPEGGDPPANFRMNSSLYGEGVRTTDPDRLTFTFDDPSFGCAQAAPSPAGGVALVEVRTMSSADPLPTDPCGAVETLLDQALTLSPID